MHHAVALTASVRGVFMLIGLSLFSTHSFLQTFIDSGVGVGLARNPLSVVRGGRSRREMSNFANDETCANRDNHPRPRAVPTWQREHCERPLRR